MMYLSYESLPPNFSVASNMLAGGFAGIAVSCFLASGASDSVSRLISFQEHSVMYPFDLLKVQSPRNRREGRALTICRLGYKS